MIASRLHPTFEDCPAWYHQTRETTESANLTPPFVHQTAAVEREKLCGTGLDKIRLRSALSVHRNSFEAVTYVLHWLQEAFRYLYFCTLRRLFPYSVYHHIIHCCRHS